VALPESLPPVACSTSTWECTRDCEAVEITARPKRRRIAQRRYPTTHRRGDCFSRKSIKNSPLTSPATALACRGVSYEARDQDTLFHAD
jgi:hypothetical protein